MAEIQLETGGKGFLTEEHIKKLMHSKYPAQYTVHHAKTRHRTSIPEWEYSTYTPNFSFIFEMTSVNQHAVVNQASGS